MCTTNFVHQEILQRVKREFIFKIHKKLQKLFIIVKKKKIKAEIKYFSHQRKTDYARHLIKI